jgi:hypothetical protein
MAKGKKVGFTFTLESKGTEATLKTAQAVVAFGASSSCIIESDGANLWLVAFVDNSMVKLLMDSATDISGEGHFRCEPAMLLNAIKNRAHIVFTLKDTVLQFKAKKGAYSGDLVTLPVSEDAYEAAKLSLVLDNKSKKAAVNLSEQMLASIQLGLACTNISAVHSVDPMETYIRLSKGRLEITSGDKFHMAFYNSKSTEKDVELQLSIPKSHFDVLSKLSAAYTGMEEPTSMFMGTDRITAVHAAYSVVLPATQSNSGNYAQAKEFLANLPKETCSFEIDRAKLMHVLGNVTSVYEEGAYVTAECVKNKDKTALQISIKTLYGSASDAITLKGFSGKLFKDKIDPRMLLDILSVMQEDALTFQIVVGKHYTISYESAKKYTATYMGCFVEL